MATGATCYGRKRSRESSAGAGLSQNLPADNQRTEG